MCLTRAGRVTKLRGAMRSPPALFVLPFARIFVHHPFPLHPQTPPFFIRDPLPPPASNQSGLRDHVPFVHRVSLFCIGPRIFIVPHHSLSPFPPRIRPLERLRNMDHTNPHNLLVFRINQSPKKRSTSQCYFPQGFFCSRSFI